MKKYILIALFALTAISCSIYHKQKVSQSTSASETNYTVRVMSYNVRHCSPPATGLIDIVGTAAAITKQLPDIVALQEIDVNTGRSGKIDQAKELGRLTKMDVYFGKAIDHDGGEYGVAILSKYNLINPVVYKLPTVESTKGEHRVLLVAEIHLPGGKFINFASTHLDAQGPSTNRDLQIAEINRIAALSKLPFVLAGDLNATPGSSVINLLDQQFTRTCQQCAPTIPANKPNKTIDFIGFTKGHDFIAKTHYVAVEPTVSDHAPIVSVLGYSSKY
ncbi:MAG: endonuclease/exonuclease/phosphatase family protein [Bacteroidota bacterium]